jgi:hypothetical protein
VDKTLPTISSENPGQNQPDRLTTDGYPLVASDSHSQHRLHSNASSHEDLLTQTDRPLVIHDAGPEPIFRFVGAKCKRLRRDRGNHAAGQPSQPPVTFSGSGRNVVAHQRPEQPLNPSAEDVDWEGSVSGRSELLRNALYPGKWRRAHDINPGPAVNSRLLESPEQPQALKDDLFSSLSAKWDHNMRILIEHQRSGMKGKYPQLEISKHSNTWHRYFFSGADIDSSTRKWSGLSDEKKRKSWMSVMIWCLITSAKDALNFLSMTHVKPLPSFEHVMDALLYLKTTRSAEIDATTDLRNAYTRILQLQVDPSRWPFYISNCHVDLLLSGCTDGQAKALLEQIISTNVYIGHGALFAFMDHLTSERDIDGALLALQRLDPELRRKSGPLVASRCMNLLRIESITFEDGIPNFRILPWILEAGVKLDLPLYNVVIKNAVRLGASTVAWELCRHMGELGISPDAYTYTTLLMDALARRDSGALEDALTAVHARADLYRNPYLVSQLLVVIRVIHRHELKLNSKVVFSNMLTVYCRAFDTAPLRHLRMLGPEVEEGSNRGSDSLTSPPNAITPGPDLLALLVHSYVLAHHSPATALSLFDWIEFLRSQDDPLALAITQYPQLYDGFLVRLSNSQQFLAKCVDIIRLMLDRGIIPPVRTWDILAHGFAKRGQSEAAKEIKDFMNGLERPPARQSPHRPDLEPSNLDQIFPDALAMDDPGYDDSPTFTDSSADDDARMKPSVEEIIDTAVE